MNLFGFNITRRSSPPSPPETPVSQLSPAAVAWLCGESAATGGPLLTNAYQQVVWVYRAINVLAEQIANLPFLFSRGERGRENLITSGPLHDFYNRPHPHINRFQYWELRIIWLMLRGESMRIPIFEDSPTLNLIHNPTLNLNRQAPLPSDGRGIKGEGPAFRTPDSELRTTQRGLSICTPHPSFSTGAEDSLRNTQYAINHAPRTTHQAHESRRTLKKVLILDPSLFQHIIQDNELVGWRYTGGGPNTPLLSQVFLPEEVWFEKLPNPFDFWRGMSPLLTAGLAVKTDFAAGAFMNGLMENNGDLGLIVRTQGQLEPEQREQLLAALRDRKRRAGTADRPLLLWSAAEVIKPQLSSADLQYLENRKFSRAEICAAFGVPEEIVTITDNAKYDVMSGSRLNFIENRVAPLCARLEAEEQLLIKSIDPTAAGWFDLDSLPILQDARRTRLTTAKTAFDMGVPFNELNQVLDLGFKPTPWGNKGHLPNNIHDIAEVPVAQPSPAASASGVPPPPSPFARARDLLRQLRQNSHIVH
jgi:HK97 family phage portal protein